MGSFAPEGAAACSPCPGGQCRVVVTFTMVLLGWTPNAFGAIKEQLRAAVAEALGRPAIVGSNDVMVRSPVLALGENVNITLDVTLDILDAAQSVRGACPWVWVWVWRVRVIVRVRVACGYGCWYGCGCLCRCGCGCGLTAFRSLRVTLPASGHSTAPCTRPVALFLCARLQGLVNSIVAAPYFPTAVSGILSRLTYTNVVLMSDSDWRAKGA